MIDLKIGDPIPILIEKNKKSVTILNDWNTPFCFGTKLRKAEAFYHYFLKKKYKAIQIAGDPNSNFMSAFTLFFYSKKIPVLSLHSSRSAYRNANKILAERFSRKILKHPAITEDFFLNPHPFFLESFEHGDRYTNSDILVVPRWGASRVGADGLSSLWEHIYKIYNLQTLYIDIGSGATYLSAINYFKEKSIRVIGICIGLPLSKMKVYLEKMELLEYRRISSYQLVEPLVGSRFGKRNKYIIKFIEEMGAKGCLLEPIYSGISLNEILEGSSSFHGDGVFYLHQGGLLPHLIREG